MPTSKPHTDEVYRPKKKPKNPIKFHIQLNPEQKEAKKAVLNNTITLLAGSAGSGKTLLACSIALEGLFNKQYDKIIITRPTVSKEDIGFLPGDMREKMDPWVQPIYQNFYTLYGKERMQKYLDDGMIEIVPVSFMRGRAQPLHSKILTPKGWVKMGDIKVGDHITSKDGEVQEVNAIFPQGVEKVYKVTFGDGTHTLASGNHLWEVNDIYKKSIDVVDTNFIKDNLKTPNGRQSRFKIPLVSPINFKEKDLKIHPYVLGVLLGDGCITQGNISISSKDTEIIEETQNHIDDSLEIKKRAGENYDYGIGKKVRNSHIKNPIIENLKDLGLHGCGSYDKFIPQEYLFGSVKQRIELLRGLMDTDGSIFSGHPNRRETSSVANYYTISTKLKEGVEHLVQSLGGTTSFRIREKAGTIDKFGRKYNYDLYDIKIRLPQSINPFLLQRKAELFEVKENPVRIIKSVELYSEEETQCISVSSQDSLYVTDNFIVTHNTFLDSLVIVDEAQNVTHEQMEMIVSRIGLRSKMVICGDDHQIDLKNRGDSGFRFLYKASKKVKNLEAIKLLTNHRDPIVESILKYYEEELSHITASTLSGSSKK